MVRPIASGLARDFVKKNHYSGKVVNNSWLHLGVFHGSRMGGVMSFGPPMSKRGVIRLVSGTEWGGMVELNRMAFADWLPRNSESRCLAVAKKILKREYPEIEWVLTFADGCQCGDGTIYRAAGFTLLRVQTNRSQFRLPDGRVIARKTLDHAATIASGQRARIVAGGMALLDGFMFQYILPLNDTVIGRLTVERLEYSEIDRQGAGMYLGKPRKHKDNAPPIQGGEGGLIPTARLQPTSGVESSND